jgi:hemerythrin-like domain-containing protein
MRDGNRDLTRKDFLRAAAIGTPAYLLTRGGVAAEEKAREKAKGRAKEKEPQARPPEKEKKEEEVSPNEDLMREHGALRRILLIYDEGRERLVQGREMPAGVLGEAAGLVRQFVEDYHERIEEDFLFPRFRNEKRLVALVDVLQRQHDAGRAITERIAAATKGGLPKGEAQRKPLIDHLARFVRMYRPHSAREDTELFPAFHEMLAKETYEKLGEEFEEREHKMFGEGGFEKIVDQVAALERQLGIYDLAQFTPRI